MTQSGWRDIARMLRQFLASAWTPVALILSLAAFTTLVPSSVASATGLEGTVEGVLTVVWGDGSQEEPGSTGPQAMLTDDWGRTIRVRIGDEIIMPLGGLEAVNGRRVLVRGRWLTSGRPGFGSGDLEAQLVVLVDEHGPHAITALTGSHPWVSIMCKFTNISSEPKSLSYFQNMFAGSYPGLDHYWREVSYDHINVVGSTAAGWVNLPYPQTHYMPTPGSGCLDGIPENDADLNALFADCTAAADALVDFSNGGNPYAGINLMFNGDLDGCAWGGGHYATLDGVTKVWRTTWEPPWGYNNITVMEHEMGHGFGMPHSAFYDADNPPGAGYPYNNAWDVMSDTWSYTISDTTYGQVGQHTVTHHKDTLLGWLRAPERVTVNQGDSTTVFVERLARPTEPGPKMIKVPIPGGSRFYTVESRRRVGYDLSTPTSGVIIHEVDTARSVDAYVQGDSNGATGAARGPGNLFRPGSGNIGIVVTGAVGEGYTVAVANGSAMAASYPAVDAGTDGMTVSNLNGVFEPGETILFQPAWTNASATSVSPGGTLSGFGGPAGASYTIGDASGAYGSVASTATASCSATGNCFRLTVSDPATRPTQHWDAVVTETLSSGASKSWTLHFGESFPDVGVGHWAYDFVESLYHHGITAGCGGGLFCPGGSVTRWQMAVFLAKALYGGAPPISGTVEGRGAYNCASGGASVFTDVPPTDAACPAIHYIANRKVTVGCGGSLFCAASTVTRWQMAVFLAKSMAGAYIPSAGSVTGMGTYNCVSGGTSVFSDVPPTDPGCKAIHFIAAKGVTSGCGGGKYCPWATLTRDQMAIFIVRAFDLALYAP